MAHVHVKEVVLVAIPRRRGVIAVEVGVHVRHLAILELYDGRLKVIEHSHSLTSSRRNLSIKGRACYE